MRVRHPGMRVWRGMPVRLLTVCSEGAHLRWHVRQVYDRNSVAVLVRYGGLHVVPKPLCKTC